MTDNLSASLSPGDDERFHQFGRASTIILALILRSLIIGAENSCRLNALLEPCSVSNEVDN